MAATPSSVSTGLLSPVAFGIGVLLVLFSPLVRGGNRHLALLVMEWLGLCVLLLWMGKGLLAQNTVARSPADIPELTRLEWGLLSSPVWIGLLQLVPWPAGIWVYLPGHVEYVRNGDIVGHAGSLWFSLSLSPDATLDSMLAALPIVAAFLLGRCGNDLQVHLLTRALLMLGAVLSAMGLMQQAYFGEFLFFQTEFAGSAIGTFANHNHFANYLMMLIPLAMFGGRNALLSFRGENRRSVLAGAFSGGILLLIVAALLASASRAGVAVALLVACVSAGVLWYKPGVFRRKRWVLPVVVAGLVLLFWLMFNTRFLTARVGIDQLSSDVGLRWQLIKSTWIAAWTFFPLGSGLGTFEMVFPQFQSPRMGGAVPHAHSDYLQLLMELGALFFILAYLVCRLAWIQWRIWRAWAGRCRRPPEAALQIMALVGVGGVFLHSWVEFNLRIPANAMLAALLFGLYLRPLPRLGSAGQEEDAEPSSPKRGKAVDIMVRHKMQGSSHGVIRRLKRWARGL